MRTTKLRRRPHRVSLPSQGPTATPPLVLCFAAHPDGLRDCARRARLIPGKRFSRSAPWTGKRAATGDWGLNCVGHPRNLGTRGDVRERWLSRSPIETPTTDCGRRGPGADGATHENHARPLGSYSHRHTRSRKAPQARAANLLFDTREGGGTCARVPGKPVRFFLKREKRDGEPKAEGEPAAGGAHSAAGGSGGAPWRPPQRFRAARKESGRGLQGTANRPPADATLGRHVGTSARTSPLGRLRLGFTQAPFSPVPASPENRSNSKSNGQSAAGYAVRLARSRSLPSGRFRPLRCLPAPPGLANGV